MTHDNNLPALVKGTTLAKFDNTIEDRIKELMQFQRKIEETRRYTGDIELLCACIWVPETAKRLEGALEGLSQVYLSIKNNYDEFSPSIKERTLYFTGGAIIGSFSMGILSAALRDLTGVPDFTVIGGFISGAFAGGYFGWAASAWIHSWVGKFLGDREYNRLKNEFLRDVLPSEGERRLRLADSLIEAAGQKYPLDREASCLV